MCEDDVPPIEVRPVSMLDASLLWEWANDPLTRGRSLDTRPILWPDHLGWLEEMLGRDDALVFIGEQHGTPVGVVRFHRRGDEAVISVTVAPDVRGRGVGSRLIRRATALSVELWQVPVAAVIRPENVASIRSFERAGFQFDRQVTVHGIACLRYTAPS